MNKVSVRRMEVGDIAQVVELGNSLAELETGGDAPQFYGPETLLAWLKNRDQGVLLIADDDGSVVGFSLTSILPGAKDAYLHDIGVTPTRRAEGVGKLLLESTIRELGTYAVNRIFGVVQTDNTVGLNFFTKAGFEQSPKPFIYVQRMI